MKARNRTDPSASQSVNLVCVNRNVETRDGQIGQIVAEREREREREIVATNVFLISRETPDKISTWHRECDWGTLGPWLTIKCHILVINVVTDQANSKNPPL